MLFPASFHLQLFPLITQDNIYKLCILATLHRHWRPHKVTDKNGELFCFSIRTTGSWLVTNKWQYFGHPSAAMCPVRTGSDLGTSQWVALCWLMADPSRLHPALAVGLMGRSISSLPCRIKDFICGEGPTCLAWG